MRPIINVNCSNMTVEKARNILDSVRKKKIQGIDLTVATRGSEAIYSTMFSIAMLMLVLTLQPLIRDHLAVLLGIILVGTITIILLSIQYRKVVTVREYMLLKRVFHLDEIEE